MGAQISSSNHSAIGEGNAACLARKSLQFKRLTYILYRSIEKTSLKEIRHVEFFTQFASNIRHVKDTDNVNPDVLSRAGNV